MITMKQLLEATKDKGKSDYEDNALSKEISLTTKPLRPHTWDNLLQMYSRPDVEKNDEEDATTIPFLEPFVRNAVYSFAGTKGLQAQGIGNELNALTEDANKAEHPNNNPALYDLLGSGLTSAGEAIHDWAYSPEHEKYQTSEKWRNTPLSDLLTNPKLLADYVTDNRGLWSDFGANTGSMASFLLDAYLLGKLPGVRNISPWVGNKMQAAAGLLSPQGAVRLGSALANKSAQRILGQTAESALTMAPNAALVNSGTIIEPLKEQGKSDSEIASQRHSMMAEELPADIVSSGILSNVLKGSVGKAIAPRHSSSLQKAVANAAGIPIESANNYYSNVYQMILADKYSGQPYGSLTDPLPNESYAGLMAVTGGLIPGAYGGYKGYRATQANEKALNRRDAAQKGHGRSVRDLYQDYRNKFEENVEVQSREALEAAQRENQVEVIRSSPSLRSWANKISGGQMRDEVFESIVRNAQEIGVPVERALAMAVAESNGIQGDVSEAGAIGVMQLMPETARELGVNPNDTEQNIRGGLTYLKKQYDDFGDWNLAHAAYNAGPGRVKQANNAVPNIYETQNYVSKINGFLNSSPEIESNEKIYSGEQGQGEGKYWVRQGDNVSLEGAQPNLLNAIDMLGKFYNERTGKRLVVTAGTNGTHADGEHSHGAGWKVDINDYGGGEVGANEDGPITTRDFGKGNFADELIRYGQSLGLGMNWEGEGTQNVHIDVALDGTQWDGTTEIQNFGGFKPQNTPSIENRADRIFKENYRAPEPFKTSLAMPPKNISVDMAKETPMTSKFIEEWANDRKNDNDTKKILGGMFNEEGIFQNTKENRDVIRRNYSDELNSYALGRTALLSDDWQAESPSESVAQPESLAQNTNYPERENVIKAADKFLAQLREEGDSKKSATMVQLQRARDNGNVAEVENILRQNGVAVPSPQQNQSPPAQEQQPNVVQNNKTPENVLTNFTLGTVHNAKFNVDEFTAKLTPKVAVPGSTRERLKKLVKSHGGYYDSAAKIYSFAKEEARKSFLTAAENIIAAQNQKTPLSFTLGQITHPHFGTKHAFAKPGKVNNKEMKELEKVAGKHGGFFDKDFTKTFLFKDDDSRDAFVREINPPQKENAQSKPSDYWARSWADIKKEAQERGRKMSIARKVGNSLGEEVLGDSTGEGILPPDYEGMPEPSLAKTTRNNATRLKNGETFLDLVDHDRAEQLRNEQKAQEEERQFKARQDKQLKELEARQAEAKRLRDESRRLEERRVAAEPYREHFQKVSESEAKEEEELRQERLRRGDSLDDKAAKQVSPEVYRENYRRAQEKARQLENNPEKQPSSEKKVEIKTPSEPQTKSSEPEVKVKPIEKKIIRGNTTEVLTDDRTRHQVQYKVVEADSLVTSHFEGEFGIERNEKYPQELQPRERESAAMQLQIQNIGENLDPLDLMEDRNVNNGAPVVRHGEDNVVINGNGRTMGIRYAYAHGKAEAYKKALIENAQKLGLSAKEISQMKKPVLVKELTRDLSERETAGITNTQTGGAQMSAREIAQTDAKKLKAQDFAYFPEGGVVDSKTETGKDFLTSILGKIITPNEHQKYAPDNKITAAGIKRAEDALFAKAYGVRELIALKADGLDESIKNVLTALQNAAPYFAKVKASMEAGKLHSYDLSSIDLAARTLKSLREQRKAVDDFLKENTLGGMGLDAETKEILSFLDKNKTSALKTTDFFREIARLIDDQGAPLEEDIFGNKVEPLPLSDLINRAENKAEELAQERKAKNKGKTASKESDLFSANQKDESKSKETPPEENAVKTLSDKESKEIVDNGIDAVWKALKADDRLKNTLHKKFPNIKAAIDILIENADTLNSLGNKFIRSPSSSPLTSLRQLLQADADNSREQVLAYAAQKIFHAWETERTVKRNESDKTKALKSKANELFSAFREKKLTPQELYQQMGKLLYPRNENFMTDAERTKFRAKQEKNAGVRQKKSEKESEALNKLKTEIENLVSDYPSLKTLATDRIQEEISSRKSFDKKLAELQAFLRDTKRRADNGDLLLEEFQKTAKAIQNTVSNNRSLPLKERLQEEKNIESIVADVTNKVITPKAGLEKLAELGHKVPYLEKFSRRGNGDTTIKNYVDAKDLTPAQKLLQDFGRKLGVRVIFFKNENDNFHGAHIGGITYLNANSNMSLGKVFWHESMHWLKNNNPKLYQELAKAAGITDAQRQAYLERTKRTDLSTDEAIDEEIISDQFEDVAKRSGLLQSVAGKDRSLIQRVIQWLQDTLNKFIAHFRNPDGKLTTAQAQALAKEFGKIANELTDSNGEKLFRYNRRTHNVELADGRNFDSIKHSDNRGAFKFNERPLINFLREIPVAFSSRGQIKAQENSGTTQVAGTKTMYVKAIQHLRNLKSDIETVLDYGAGLGLGTDAMRENNPDLRIDSYEPNPKRWQGKTSPTFTNNTEIKNHYDTILNTNVLNVVEPEIRDLIVRDIGSLLNVNGKALITTRSWRGDIEKTKNYTPGKEPHSVWITRKSDGKTISVYQKGFDGNELLNYVSDLLGKDFKVEKVNGFGKSGVIVTRIANSVDKNSNEPKYSLGASDNSSESTLQKIRNKVSAWFGDKETLSERRSKRIVQRLEGLTKYKIAFNGTDKAIVDDFHKLIRLPHSQQWEKNLPEVSAKIAHALNLPSTDEMANYITDWILTGAPNNSSPESTKFQAAMTEKPAERDALLALRQEFQEIANLTPQQTYGEKLVYRQNNSLIDFLKKKVSSKEEWVDDLAPIQKMLDEIAKDDPQLAAELKKGINPVEAARLYRGKGGMVDRLMLYKTGKNLNEIKRALAQQYPNVNFQYFKPLESILEEAGGKEDLNAFEQYCAAKLDKEIFDWNRNQPDEEHYTPTISDESKVDAVIAEGDAKFERAHRDLMSFQRTLLDIQFDAGLLTENQYHAIKKKWENYIPMVRVFDENEDYSFADSLKERKTGSERDFYSPMQKIIANTQNFVRQAERNKIKLQIAGIARMGAWAKFVEERDTSTPNVKDHFAFFESGKKKWIRTAPEVVRAVNAIQTQNDGFLITKIITAGTAFVRAAYTTMNLDYAAGNIVRDSADAFLHNKYYGRRVIPFLSFVDALKGGLAAVTKDPDFIDWLANGGSQSSLVSPDVNYTSRAIENLTMSTKQRFLTRPVSTALDHLQLVAEYSEYATRLANYKRAKNELAKQRADGKATVEDKRKAALVSREATIDFAKAGHSMRAVNRIFAFSNAAVQSWYLDAQTFNPAKLKTAEGRKDLFSAFARLALNYVVPAFLFGLFNRDKDWYKEKKDWEKETYWFLPGTDIKIPKGLDFAGRLASTIIDESLQSYHDQRPYAWKRLFDTAWASAPSLSATLATPAIEVALNRSYFRDAPIVPASEEHLSPEDQFGTETSPVAKHFGKLTGFSPRKLDYLISGYLGFMGKFFTGGTDEIPMARRFINTPFKNPKTVQEYYETYDKQDKLYNSWKLHLKEDGKAKPPEEFDSALYSRLKRASKQMRKISEQIRLIEANEKLNSVEREEKIKALEQRRLELCKRVLKPAR